VVRFSRNRKRYERQGLLVESAALAHGQQSRPEPISARGEPPAEFMHQRGPSRDGFGAARTPEAAVTHQSESDSAVCQT
jgi:hypothetical protein